MNPRRAAHAVAAVSALAVAAAPAPAPAAAADSDPIRRSYDVQFHGRVQFETHEATEEAMISLAQAARFGVRVRFGEVRFLGERMVTGASTRDIRIEGLDVDHTFVNQYEPYTRTCGPSVTEPSNASVMPTSVAEQDADGLLVDLVPFHQLKLTLECTIESPQVFAFGGQVRHPGRLSRLDDHFRITFRVPRDKLGDSHISIAAAQRSSALESCPIDGPDVRRCVSSVAGTVVLRRTATSDRGEEDPHDDMLAPPPPLIVEPPRIDRPARAVRVGVRCERGCRATLRATLPARRGRGRARGRNRRGRAAAPAGMTTIAQRSVRLPAGRGVRRLALAIPPGRRPAVRAAGFLMLEVTLDPPRGRTVRRVAGAPVGR